MSTPFQNRLVGTIIVSAAIIIFLPDILDGEKKSYQADFEAIPTAPAFVKKQADKSFPQEKLNRLTKKELSDEQAADDVNVSHNVKDNKGGDVKISVLTKDKAVSSSNKLKAADKVKTKTTSTKKSTASKQKTSRPTKTPAKAVIDRAWVIHLGSFRHKQNVKELLAKLKKNGYTAYTKPIKTKNGTLTKVFVGPELIKSSLEKKLPKLKKLTNVQGKVARYKAN